MRPTWDAGEPPLYPPYSLSERIRIAWRLPVIFMILAVGLTLLALLRLIERPLFGHERPMTPSITKVVCRLVLQVMGLPVRAEGQQMVGRGAIVANHASWLDIFVLNSQKTIYFVSKSEVASWPGIGLLARATGTVFIKRDPREAAEQTRVFQERLMNGHRLLFFPEGTSTDGLRVLPFKTTLFAAFYDEALVHDLNIQAVSVRYHAPTGGDPRFYGWWGNMDFAPSLLRMLAQRRHGHVSMLYHPPVKVDAFANRKSLARHMEDQVRRGHDMLENDPA